MELEKGVKRQNHIFVLVLPNIWCMDDTDLWIKEQHKYLYADKNYQREPLEYLNLYFCFIDTTDSIVKIDTEKYLFSNNESIIRETDILQMVEKRRQSKYIFQEMSLFHINLESTDMHNYAKSRENEYNFVESYPVIRDIFVAPSIFIFQPVNYLLILLKERLVQKSSLKTSGGSKKQVRFADDRKKTRRNNNAKI